MQIEALLRLVPALEGREVVISPLAGGITNRNFRVDVDGEEFVVRIGGDGTESLGIDRAIEHACATRAAHLAIGPEVIAYLPEHAALVTGFVAGTTLTADRLRQPDVLRRIVDALRRYHSAGERSGYFSPFETIRAYHSQAQSHAVRFPPAMDAALEILAGVEAELPRCDALCPCHNDLLPANVIDDGQRVAIIDWEYAASGDPFFDLGNLAANSAFEDHHERALLELYFGCVRPDDHRRLQLMRLASDMREALWGFLQSWLSTLDFDYVGHGNYHLERFLAGAASQGARRVPLAG